MKAKLQSQMKDAMRAKDSVKLNTIRGLLSAIQYEEIQQKVEPLPEAGIIELVQRELKKRKEELEFAAKAGRAEITEKVTAEMKTLESFLPQQLDAAALEAFVLELKAATPGLQMGAAMKVLKEKFAGQYDAKMASELVKKLLA